MSEDFGLIIICLIINWIFLYFLYSKSKSKIILIINFLIQLIYSSYFISKLSYGDPSSALAYLFYFLFLLVLQTIINSIQLVISLKKSKHKIKV